MFKKPTGSGRQQKDLFGVKTRVDEFFQVTDGRMTDSLSRPFSVLKSKKSVKCRRSNELLQIAVVEFICT